MPPNGCYQALSRPFLSGSSSLISRRYTPKARSFHSSKPHQMIDNSILLAHEYLQACHSLTGLPWAASIPLAAVAVRVVVATPLHIWSLRQGQTKQQVNQFLIAWGKVHQKEVMASERERGVRMGPVLAERMVDRKQKETKKRLYKDWGVYRGATWAPILMLPVWLSVMESLRRMVGMSSGLLGAIQSWVGSASDAVIVPVEQSMATQGALWFPDLLAADSTCALPIILSATMFTNVTWGWKVQSAEEIAAMRYRKQRIRARAGKALKRTLQGLSIWLAPTMIYAEAPAGLLIYWISSTVFATAQTRILRKVMPSRKPVMPAKNKLVGSVHD